MTKSEKGATFVAVSLAASLATGVCSAVRWAGSNAVPLLVATAFLTTIMAALSGWVAYRTWKAHRAAEDAANLLMPLQLLQKGIWHWLSRRQWNTLLLGITAIVALTGTLAGFQVLGDDPAEATAANPPPATAAPFEPPPPPPVVETTEPADEPSPTPDPTDVSPSAEATDQPPVPEPSATAWLDTMDPVEGSYNSGAVAFAARRYPRSLSMYCYRSNASGILWNVAGYREFNATLGIGDDTEDAFGAIAEFIFYNQDGTQIGKPVDVRVGHPQVVRLPLTGVVQLLVTCSGRDAKTNDARGFYGTLGDPMING